jgi:hypothetical protein
LSTLNIPKRITQFGLASYIFLTTVAYEIPIVSSSQFPYLLYVHGNSLIDIRYSLNIP